MSVCMYLDSHFSDSEKDNFEFIFDAQDILFPLWLRNRLISTGLKMILSHTEKSCIA